jgi:putative transposase
MRRTNTFRLVPRGEQEAMLEELADASAAMWNSLNYRRRQSFFASGRVDWTYGDIYRAFAPVLGATTAQQVIRKNTEAWRSFLALLKLKKAGRLPPHIEKVSPPGYWKDRNTGQRHGILILRHDIYRISGRWVEIPVGRALKKKYGLGARERVRVRLRGRPRWRSKQGRMEVIRDDLSGRWYAYQSVEVDPPHQPGGSGKVFVDINMCNLLVALAERGVPEIYRANHLLSDWLYWERRIAEHQSILKRMNGRHTSRRLRKLYRTRQRRLRHDVNTLARRFVEQCWRAGVAEIYVDDPTHSREGKHWSRKSNKLLHNYWCYRHLMHRLRCSAEEYGIQVIPAKASSTRCGLCGGDRDTTGCRRVHRGLFVCRTHGLAINADVNSCLNLAKAILPNPYGDRDNRAMTRPVAVR